MDAIFPSEIMEASRLRTYRKPPNIYWVSTVNSPEFKLLRGALTRSSLVALDAEWKPIRTQTQQQPAFPTVSLLQLACRLDPRLDEFPVDSAELAHYEPNESIVFLIDLQEIDLGEVHGILKEVFANPDVLKLGFRFKQDLVYLSSTLCDYGGLEKVEPFLDITNIYSILQQKDIGRKASKDIKSLATICKELLGLTLTKELQCSDWSYRPLSEEQKVYAAIDAHCLLEIFAVFLDKFEKGGLLKEAEKVDPTRCLGLKDILDEPTMSPTVFSRKFVEASDIVRAAAAYDFLRILPTSSSRSTRPMDMSLCKIIKKYGTKVLLKEADKKPRYKKKGKNPRPLSSNAKQAENLDDWVGPSPWDLSSGGDRCPKFLCDVMVEGLAKHLRCVGIDAAVPCTKKPESRELLEQALREKRVLLTRDAKLLRHDYLLKNQIYRVKSLLKNEQLMEVIETFKLKISEDQLMSRCTKCNGQFVQRPLTTEEAMEAAKGFQKIPNCLFNKNLEFWQCKDCKQLYWEGTQYHNAVQKFVDVCKLNE